MLFYTVSPNHHSTLDYYLFRVAVVAVSSVQGRICIQFEKTIYGCLLLAAFAVTEVQVKVEVVSPHLSDLKQNQLCNTKSMAQPM